MESKPRTCYRIENRWPDWSRWRIVTPAPHSERFPFDAKGLRFSSLKEAEAAVAILVCANSGSYRIAEAEQEVTRG